MTVMITDVYFIITTLVVPVKYGSLGLTFQKVLLAVGVADLNLLYHFDVAPRQRPPTKSGHNNCFIIKTSPPVGITRLLRTAGQISWYDTVTGCAKIVAYVTRCCVHKYHAANYRLGVKVLFWPMTTRTCVSIHPYCCV